MCISLHRNTYTPWSIKVFITLKFNNSKTVNHSNMRFLLLYSVYSGDFFCAQTILIWSPVQYGLRFEKTGQFWSFPWKISINMWCRATLKTSSELTIYCEQYQWCLQTHCSGNYDKYFHHPLLFRWPNWRHNVHQRNNVSSLVVFEW